MSDTGTLFAMSGPLWTIAKTLTATIVACVLVLDANWMAAILRSGIAAAPPPLFRAPIRIEGGWRRALYLALAVLIIVPMFMLPFMGIQRLLPSSTTGIILAALAVSIALIFLAEATGRLLMGRGAAAMTAFLLIAPYLVSGPVGWIRYSVVVATMLAIVLLLFVVAAIHKAFLLYRPRSRFGAGLRLIVDAALGVTVIVATFWPRFG
ncbi:hypothetical protein U1769_00860 [Sphingomonas sp. ZT3P38]|uniref:hypothetical protein n=1 Tax=Parasphingomonas zepuensis TaxID=3096161 RepID=UPI002FCC393D